jgi:tetratricopeptide (TPR) repeat protein
MSRRSLPMGNCSQSACHLLFLLCLVHGPASRGQNSDGNRQQTNAGPVLSQNVVKPGESRTPDPGLAPARSLLQQGMLGEAEADTRTYLQTHADSADAHFLLGFILFREIQGKWLESGKKDAEASRYNTGDLSGSLTTYRDAKVKESLAEFTTGAKYQAPGSFELKIVALDYLLLKDYINADHWLTRSIESDPRDAQAWYYMGRTKYSESQFSEAIQAFAHCLKLEPRNIQAENNVGLSYEALGQRDQAIQAFQNAIAWQSETQAKDPEPFVEVAHLYLEQNQPERAVPYLEQSIAMFPRVAKAHQTLGKAYSLLHRLPEAQAELEKAIALEPETASLHCMLGQVYRQEGRVSDAKTEFDRCTELQQTSSRTHYRVEPQAEKKSQH